jgi:hypothetical protein
MPLSSFFSFKNLYKKLRRDETMCMRLWLWRLFFFFFDGAMLCAD